MNHRLCITLFLLIIWYGFSSDFDLSNILLGLAFSLLIPYLVLPKQVNFKVNIFQMIILVLYTIWELFRSSLEVAWDIVTPKSRSQSKIIKLPLQCQHSVQISLLANLISLTPGTLAIDVEEENTILVIHVMFAQNQEKIIEFIKKRLEPKIIKVIQYG